MFVSLPEDLLFRILVVYLRRFRGDSRRKLVAQLPSVLSSVGPSAWPHIKMRHNRAILSVACQKDDTMLIVHESEVHQTSINTHLIFYTMEMVSPCRQHSYRYTLESRERCPSARSHNLKGAERR